MKEGPAPTTGDGPLSDVRTPLFAVMLYFTISEKLLTCAPVPPVQISKPISIE